MRLTDLHRFHTRQTAFDQDWKRNLLEGSKYQGSCLVRRLQSHTHGIRYNRLILQSVCRFH